MRFIKRIFLEYFSIEQKSFVRKQFINEAVFWIE